MSTITVARSAGFCFGVSRSVEMTRRELDAGPCWALGEIIHNGDVMRGFAARGLSVAERPADVPAGARVIIRAHGASEAECRALRDRGALVVDATCPYVARIHRIVRRAEEAGRRVLVIGDADHPEVRAICGWCRAASVAADAAALDALLASGAIPRDAPLCVVSQTTQTAQNLRECEILLKKLCTNAEVFDTICNATSTRQEEASELASKCDAMVVIGGKHSANSLHLAELCTARCANTQFVQNAAELDTARLRGANSIGVTAGASAPEWIIKEVLDKMSDEIITEEIPEVNKVPAQEAAAENTAEQAAAQEAAPVEAPVEEAPAAEAPKAEQTFDEMLEDSFKAIYNGDKVSGVVAAITPTEVSVDMGAKYSGFIPVSEFEEDGEKVENILHVGDPIEAVVVRVNDVEGTAQLSKKRLDAVKNWADIEAAHEAGTVVEGVVTEENKGGVVVSVKGVRVFVPASQSGLPKDTPMTELVKQKVRLKITEVNRGRRRVVGSIRAVQQKERRERADAVWSGIEVGRHYKGVVKSLTSYGAFVDIGGIDGMVHVSELSWDRIRQPSDVVSVGDELDVHVLSFDKDARRISLGCKEETENPWTRFTDAFKVGDVARTKIVKLMPFGAFAEVIPGVDGLIHISQIANRRIGKPDEVLSVGDTVEAKITAIDNDKQKISLSIRALSEPEPAPRRKKPSAAPVPQEDALVYEVSADGEATGNAPEENVEPEE